MTSVNPQRQPVGSLLTHHLLGLYPSMWASCSMVWP